MPVLITPASSRCDAMGFAPTPHPPNCSTQAVPMTTKPSLHPDIDSYHAAQAPADRAICEALAKVIMQHLADAENKVWHRHPVWFLDGNPIVGYSKL
ncbi:MAG: hypothetical protein JNJ64_14500, partial [Flavobacteriales bacterium]|nr:hypothetical protein [Flavobacteriales bacterium]